MQSFKNHFLVSLPALKGNYFEDTVSLIIDHNEQGTFGLIINKPLNQDIDELFSEITSGFNCPVLLGGPVEQERVFFLHPTGTYFNSTLEISHEIALTTSTDIIDAMQEGSAPAGMLAIVGYAGWGATQLEQELVDDAWLLAPTSGRIAFNTPYEDRPKDAASLLGIDLNLMPTQAGGD
ncbi:MAG: YqgE/AlgH family protein [Pseudomonadales bacterium]|nr:YqgE/AlgH family protein [Pseudomonadales bacterium]